MVCKEDVFNWFKLLSPSKRVEVMCGLLHMCYPLELRFMGSCLENLARKDFHFLREAELKANNPTDLGKLSDMQSEITCARLVTYLALLHSTSNECANMVYNHILNCVEWSTRTLPMESELAKELLLMLTMAANSPAFTIDQRQIICDHISTLKNLFYAYIHQEECSERCLHNQKPVMDTGSNASARLQPVHITSIKMKGHQKRLSDGHCEFLMQVTWSNSEVTTVSRTYQELHDFHVQLLKLFPDDAGAHRQERKIPFLHSGRRNGSSSDNDEQNMAYVEEYTNALSSMPEHLLFCDHMMNFFGPPPVEESTVVPPGVCYPEMPEEVYPCSPRGPVPVYGSIVIPVVQDVREMPAGPDNQVPPLATTNVINTPTTNHRLAYTHRVPSLPVPQVSPLPSPLTSPHEATSGLHGGKTVSEWLKEMRLQKYNSLFSKYSIQELFLLNDETLESFGMPAGARKKFLNELENLKTKRGMNGMVADSFPRPDTPQSPMMMYHTPPSQYVSQVESTTDSLSSDYSPAVSPRADGEEKRVKPSGHMTVAQKSASLPSLSSREEVRLNQTHSQQDMRSESIRHPELPLRPTVPTSPAPSALNPRFLVRSPLRVTKPVIHQVSPPLPDLTQLSVNVSPVPDSDRQGEVATTASISVVTSTTMYSGTSVTISTYKSSNMASRPNSLGELDQPAALPAATNHQPHQIVPMPPNFNYPPPPLLAQGMPPAGQIPIDPGSMAPLPIQHPEHVIAHGYSVGNNNNQAGYQSDSSVYQGPYGSTVPLNANMPPNAASSHVANPGYPGATTVTYVGGGQSFVPPHNAMPVSSYQFTLPPGVPPPMMSQNHCHVGCSSCGCPGNPLPQYISVGGGQVVQYPAFIPTSNGLISPSIPAFNMNGVAPHLRGMPYTGFFPTPPLQAQKGRVLECYNCGQRGHKGSECKEQSMDRMTYGGMFHLKYIEEEGK